MPEPPIRVAHVLYHFGIGGLENGLVNLINGLDESAYEHAIVCMTDHDDDYVRRLRATNYTIHALHKRPGQDPAVWGRMWRSLRAIRPDILHTRNLTSLEMQLVGAAAGVRGRIHGEHGWDMQDLDGRVQRYRLLRRCIGMTVHRFVALSRDLEHYLIDSVGIPARKVAQIYNGVDCARFRPRDNATGEQIVVGTVGRMQAVKNQTFLCRAFVVMARERRDLIARLRLRLVGDGPLVDQCIAIMSEAGLRDRLDLPGPSNQVERELAAMDVFVLPSLAEGISNTILEAMAAGLPVVATAVGGNPELVEAERSGKLVDTGDIAALARALIAYADDSELRLSHGARGRQLAEAHFSLQSMLQAYDGLYRTLAS